MSFQKPIPKEIPPSAYSHIMNLGISVRPQWCTTGAHFQVAAYDPRKHHVRLSSRRGRTTPWQDANGLKVTRANNKYYRQILHDIGLGDWPVCCERLKDSDRVSISDSGVSTIHGEWEVNTYERIHFCPFCGTKLP